MKKLAIAALVAAAATIPAVAFANEPAAAAKKEAPAAAATAPAAAATAPAAGAPKPMELKAGGWVKIEGDKALVSKDDGKTWSPAPDGTHEFKDGTKAETKGGLLIKK